MMDGKLLCNYLRLDFKGKKPLGETRQQSAIRAKGEAALVLADEPTMAD